MFKKLFFTAAFLLIVVAFTTFYGTPVFKGKSESITLYYMSNSSMAIETRTDKAAFSFNAYGESFSVKTGDVSVSELLTEFEATLIFTETIAEGKSFYAYSPRIKYLKIIDGKRVNLHVFVGETQTTVGTPVIFGSF